MTYVARSHTFRQLPRHALRAGLLGLALAFTGGGAALAQTVVGASTPAVVDPPGRVARLDFFEGGMGYLPAGSQEWTSASLNRPLIAGDRLSTEAGARAELHLGSTALRLGGQTQVDISTLDDQQAYITLNQGAASLRVRTLFPGQHLEVNTGNVAFSITQPGEYRVDVDPASGTTRVSVASGGGVVYGENGQTMVMNAPQQIRFSGRALAQASAQNVVARDAFDQWAEARDRQEDQSVSARYVSREMPGYQQLDSYGDWATVQDLGPVWYPRVTVQNWQPYRYGHWRHIEPWGWTWVDDAPWGFAPSHYGRWTQVGPRWAWVPGPMQPRPVYAPALVAFVGGNSGGVNWSISLGSGRPGVAWFPLAPGEAYRPAFRASPTYVNNINRTVVVNRNVTNVNVTNVYRFQRPETVTAQAADAFARGRPTRDDMQRVAQADLQRARVVNGPDIQPERRDRPADRPGITAPQVAQPQPNPQFQRNDRNDRNDRSDGNQVRERDNMTMAERQQLQAQRDQERRNVAEQQQRQLQDGARRQQQEQADRVQRQQRENQLRFQQQRDDQQRGEHQRAQQEAAARQQRVQQEQQAHQQRQQQEQQAQQQRQQQEQAARQQQQQQRAAQDQQRQAQTEQRRADRPDRPQRNPDDDRRRGGDRS